MARKSGKFFEQAKERKGVVSRARSTYSMPERVGSQPYYWNQYIGSIIAFIPNILFTVSYEDGDWYGVLLNQGHAGTTAPPGDFLVDSDGNLQCNTSYCQKLSIDPKTGYVIFQT